MDATRVGGWVGWVGGRRAVVFFLLPWVAAACGGSAARDPRPSSPLEVVGGEGGDAPNSSGAGPGAGAATGGVSERGGAASGGASGGGASGGTLAGGMGGQGPEPKPLPLPTDCSPRSQMETADTCSLAVYCDTASRLTSCGRLASGRWRCQCDPIHPERVYHVEGAAGLEACAVAATACSDKLELGEETCNEVSGTSPQGDCSTELECGRPIQLGVATDARAWLMRFGWSRCQRSEVEGLLDCQCSRGTQAEYELASIGEAAACRPLVDFCMSDTPPTYEGGEECFLKEASSTTEGCERLESCVVPMHLGAARLGFAEPRYSSCVPAPGGGSDCYCSTRTTIFSFHSASSSSAATCDSSILNCTPDAVVELTGSATCTPTSASAALGTHCEADLDCNQSATVAGRPIIAKGRLLTKCGRLDETSPWWCSCASDQKTTRFSLGAPELSASQACSQAPATCIESLPVHFGPYGELVFPPDPVP